jgi:hypothetical protein
MAVDPLAVSPYADPNYVPTPAGRQSSPAAQPPFVDKPNTAYDAYGAAAAIQAAVVAAVAGISEPVGLSAGTKAGLIIAKRPQCYGVPLFAYGTSYTNGANSSVAANSFVALSASALGATVTTNKGSGGSNTPSMPAQYMSTTNPWTPGTSTGVILLEAGIGEALSAAVTTEAQSRVVFEECLHTALRWFRAKSVVTFDDSTVAMGGFVFESVNSVVIPIRGAKATTAMQQMTITPNGPKEIVLLTAPWRALDAELSDNSDFQVQVDGGAWHTGTTKHRGDTRFTNSVLYTFGSFRITNLTPTSVINIRKIGTGNLWLLDRYLVMGNTTPPPIVLIQDCPLVLKPDTNRTRTNIVTNPSFETDTTGWSISASSTLTRSTAQAHDGAASAAAVWGTNSPLPVVSTTVPVITGLTYTASAWVFVPSGAGSVKLTAFTSIPAQVYSLPSTVTNGWQRLTVTFTASATGSVTLGMLGNDVPVIGSTVYLDSVLVEVAPSMGTYFDTTVTGMEMDGLWNKGGTYGPLASNAVLEAYRAIVRRIAASPEFNDGTVVVADPALQWDEGRHISYDGIHPNDEGHAVYADAIIRAVQSIAQGS